MLFQESSLLYLEVHPLTPERCHKCGRTTKPVLDSLPRVITIDKNIR